MALAIFDLDETLISADSDHAWGQYVVEAGMVDPKKHAAQNDAFYQQYKDGVLDIDEYLRFSCSVLTQYSMQELHEHRARFFESKIKPLLLPAAVDLVKQHQSDGDTLLVITSTIEFVTQPIVEWFGIETLIAPDPEIIDNRYTGNIVGVPSFGPGKVTRLNKWLEDKSYSLKGSYFYSDSHNDLPLLRLVDHPVAVDPDPVLQAEAEKNAWTIISLRS